MRLAGQTKNGFFPAPDEAIEGILKHLETAPCPADKAFNLLDPCAGEGKAIAKLGRELAAHCYAIELNGLRAERIAANYPDVNLLGPCSITGCRVSFQSMSLLYLNPPFDDEMGGGGREELAFLSQATNWLIRGGILVMVMPVNQVIGNDRMVDYLDSHYEDLDLYKFPDGYRQFREVVVFGKRRKEDVERSYEMYNQQATFTGRGYKNASEWRVGKDATVHVPELGQPSFSVHHNGMPDRDSDSSFRTWTIPTVPDWQPRMFDKVKLTDEEIGQLLAKSPAYKVLETREDRALARPPLPLGKGHTGMIIMCGVLDGYVASDPPHVVRGGCGKINKHVSSSCDVTEAGTTIEKEVYLEIPAPMVRAVWGDGKIRTLDTKPDDADAVIDVEGEELPEEE